MLPTKTLEGGRLILPMNGERFERHQALVEDIAYSGMSAQEIAKKYGLSADCSSCRPTRNVMTTGSTTSLRGLPEWICVAVELRHHSWAVDPVFDLLSRHHANLRGDEWRRPALCPPSHLDNGLRAAPRP
jgi:hypothetical protein